MLLTAATFTTHSLHAAIVCAFFFFILILSLTAPTNGLKGYSFPIRASKVCNPSHDRIPPMDHLKISPSLSSASLLLLTRVKPLFTVGNNNNLNPIPRLELGLRLLKSYTLPITISKINIHPFPLDYLYHYEPMVQQTSNDANHCLSALSNMGKLFSSITRQTQSFVSGMVVRYLKRVVSATIILASSLSSVVMPGPMMMTLPPSGGSHLQSALRRSVLAASPMMSVMMIGPRLVANAGVLKPYSRLTPTEKLSTTPLYFVSNSRGNAYLQEDVQGAQPDQKVVTYFMSSEDANHFLNEMAQVNQHSPNEFRLMTVSMEKIVNQIQTRKQSRKLGRYKMDLIYRIQPSSRQFENAEQILAGGSTKADVKATNAKMLLKGLTMKRPNGELVTPYYFAYEDLIDDWNKLPVAMTTGSSKSSKSSKAAAAPTAAAPPPSVTVTDFAEVMCLAQGITQSSIASSSVDSSSSSGSSSSSSPRPTSDQIKQIVQHTGIVPPRREIEMIKRFYRNQAGRKNEFSKSKLNL